MSKSSCRPTALAAPCCRRGRAGSVQRRAGPGAHRRHPGDAEQSNGQAARRARPRATRWDRRPGQRNHLHGGRRSSAPGVSRRDDIHGRTQFRARRSQVRLRSDRPRRASGGQRHQGRVPRHRRQDQQDIGDHRTTPSATMGIRGGIMVFGVQASATTSIFVYGNSMTVTANGVTQTVTVPGFGEHPDRRHAGRADDRRAGQPRRGAGQPRGNCTAAAATVAAIEDARRQQPRQRGHAAGPHPGDRRLRIRLHRSPRPPPRPRCP